MGLVARTAWTALALLMVVLSAFAVIGSTHQSRGFYARLQEFEAQRWYLEEEYSRLLLEQSTWASHNRIESAAGDSLQLVVPGHDRTRLVAR